MRSAIAYFDPRVNNGISGTVVLRQSSPRHAVELEFDLKGFRPNQVHAVHIHEFGDLTQGCASLGAHFNPTQVPHGHGHAGHAGDLFNNLQSNGQGRFQATFATFGVSLVPGAPGNVVGRSIVLHQFPDDLGRQGVDGPNGFVPYDALATADLRALSADRGYPMGSRYAMLQKLKIESITTGNAATRIACAIIGVKKST